jgi:prepilin-type N-terminal cleavage/methylation domain-containing protein
MAVRAPPTCRKPVGEGANRSFMGRVIGRGEYQTPHYNARMRRQRGFSLPEVLAALLILTLVITVSFTAFLERNRRLQQAGELMLAYQALANEAEYQRRVPYDDLVPTDEFEKPIALLEPLKPYQTTVEVEEVEDGVANVTLTIRWHNLEKTAKLILVRTKTGGTELW